MGNGAAKLKACFFGCGVGNRRRDSSVVLSEPCDEGLGHSFCYVRPDAPFPLSGSSKVHHSEETTIFRSISGAAVSANTATPLSTALLLPLLDSGGGGAAFESSTSFSAVPLQPVPRFSGPLFDRGFLSGPIKRGGFMSGPIDPYSSSVIFSGPLDRRTVPAGSLRRSLSHGLALQRRAAASLLGNLAKTISRTISVTEPKHRESDSSGSGSTFRSCSIAVDDSESGENLHWAQGRAGEDRVHVVVSEDHGWLFVGIYDGFNGPDATDYLLSNLYSAVQQELKGLLWDEEKPEILLLSSTDDSYPAPARNRVSPEEINVDGKPAITYKKIWKYEWARESLELSQQSFGDHENHNKVLKALSHALMKTEVAFLDTADNMVSENPELALMGSCVLVMVMKGEDVYLMNVGDSRAVLAQKAVKKEKQNLERINEEILNGLENNDGGEDQMEDLHNLVALQLTKEHSTGVEEEAKRIRNEHPDDASAIVNDRVKGSLKVTRAFGAGFLKQPKWNNALLEMFRIDYMGSSPYITCCPFLHHHRLGHRDMFLILSSDGLYQYFTNEEAVAEVEFFFTTNTDGDPAQHLVEQILFRAAKRAGMDFHELLEIPQGDRRRYHDDVSVIIISFEGRIWKSSM